MNTEMELGLSQNDGSGLMPEVINGEVDARAVHEALEVKSNFREWINRRIEDFGFVEGEDFRRIFDASPLRSGRIDYALTLDMAKELAMVERNEAGRKMRRYFIECEKRLIQGPPSPAATLPDSVLLKLQAINAGVIEELMGQAARIEKLEATARPGPDWLSPVEWLAARGIHVNAGRICVLAQKCTTRSGAQNLPVGYERTKYHDRRTYAPSVIEAVAASCLPRWRKIDAEKGGQP